MLEIVLMLIAAYFALHYAGIMCACIEERRGRREGRQRERERERGTKENERGRRGKRKE